MHHNTNKRLIAFIQYINYPKDTITNPILMSGDTRTLIYHKQKMLSNIDKQIKE